MSLTNYKPLTTAMSHQRDAIAAAAAKPPVPSPEDVFAYLMDMGTGKSKVVLDEWGEMATSGGPQDLLLFAPAGSYRNWWADKSKDNLSEFNKHMDPEFREALIDVPWVSGGGAKLKKRLELMLSCRDKKRPRALIVNIEAMSRVDKIIKLCQEFVEQRGAHVVVDESTTIKGQSSSRTKNIIKIGEDALSKRILSGNWTPKSPLDLFAQCQFLDPRILGHGSFYSFRAKYAVLKKMNFGGRDVPVVVGYRNIEELQERTRRYSYRVLKSECLDLDPKVYVTRDVELTDKQREMYSQINLFGHAEIAEGKFVTTDLVIKRAMRLHQINCGFVMDDEERVLHEVPETRTDALVELLEEHRGKAIVWACFRYSVDKIVTRLRKEFGPNCVAQFHGGNKRERIEEERRFLGDPECRFMVATQAAGMRGNTWVNADLTVYYANNYDLEQREQSEDRNHRKGQVNRVTIVDLVARGTVDEKIVKNLKNKIVMGSMITGEELREWMI